MPNLEVAKLTTILPVRMNNLSSSWSSRRPRCSKRRSATPNWGKRPVKLSYWRWKTHWRELDLQIVPKTTCTAQKMTTLSWGWCRPYKSLEEHLLNADFLMLETATLVGSPYSNSMCSLSLWVLQTPTSSLFRESRVSWPSRKSTRSWESQQ